jgi:hypothetical protein
LVDGIDYERSIAQAAFVWLATFPYDEAPTDRFDGTSYADVKAKSSVVIAANKGQQRAARSWITQDVSRMLLSVGIRAWYILRALA